MSVDTLEIVEYQPEYQPAFYALNAAWIAPNFGLEAEDIRFLENPQEEILDKGGVIFFARYENAIVGTYGLFKMDNETYELIRVAVDPAFRGLKIGKTLVAHAIEQAGRLRARRLILESSAKPVNAKAIKLYENLGFQHYEPRPEHRSALARAEVWMKLDLC